MRGEEEKERGRESDERGETREREREEEPAAAAPPPPLNQKKEKLNNAHSMSHKTITLVSESKSAWRGVGLGSEVEEREEKQRRTAGEKKRNSLFFSPRRPPPSRKKRGTKSKKKRPCFLGSASRFARRARPWIAWAVASAGPKSTSKRVRTQFWKWKKEKEI